MITYSAPYARMRGLKGKFLGKDQLETLLQASDTQAIISILSRSEYGEQIQDSMSLSQIEHALKCDLLLSYVKILTFMRGKPARFVEALLGRFELLNVKSILRSLTISSKSKDAAEPFIFPMGRRGTIPIEELLDAVSLENCVELMKHTPFARPLEIGYERYENDKRLFPLEITLDLDYYERLQEALRALSPMDRHDAGRLLGIQYDIINLMWILRLKEYHRLPPEQIFQYILPHGWKIKERTFWKIAADSDVVGLIMSHRLNPYDRVLKSVTQIENSFILGVEIALLRYLYSQSTKVLLKFPLQAAPFLAFFILKEMEIRDIISILIGKSLELPPERIRTYLITL